MPRHLGRSRAGVSAAALACSVLFGAAGALAQKAGDCTGVTDIDDPRLATARIGGADRVYFVRGASEAKGCPAARSACRDKAFVVPGDRVVAGRTQADFTCVDYVGAKGAGRAGWLATARLVREDPAAGAADDWSGTWIGTEAEIAIKPGRAGRLSVHGDATYGALDPERVKRGAVNVGEFDGDVAPAGSRLAFDVGPDATLPFDKGDDTDCKVSMRRLEPFLLVDDNNMCGGMNVTFRGVYRRKP